MFLNHAALSAARDFWGCAFLLVRIHAVEEASRSNGPGLRAVVWFQGCTLGCSGCFNPGTHDASRGIEEPVDLLAARLAALPGIEGLSISGGEPFQQPEALLELLRLIRSTTPLSTLVFSGYTLAQIRTQPLGPSILEQVDVLIAGPYNYLQPSTAGLLGSANQRIHLLTKRYQPADLSSVARTEVILHRDGTVTVTGIHPLTVSNG